MTAVILHLSDIHIKSKQDPILKKHSEIAACTFSFLPNASHLFVIVSGDIAYSGKEEQYIAALEFFEGIRSTIKREKDVPITYLVAPGNHDCDFEKNNSARDMLITSISEGKNQSIDSSVIEICTSVQKSFFDFRDRIEQNTDDKSDLLWRTSTFNVEGKRLDFDCLNVSWVSKIKEEPGKLHFPINRYQHKSVKDADVCVVIMHHPINWFGQPIYRDFRKFIRSKANIIISGHEHQANVGILQESESDSSAYIEGCVLQGQKDLSDSSFNIAVLDLVNSQFSSSRFAWAGDMYIGTDEGSWTDYRDLPAKKVNGFPLSDSFRVQIDDPGAYFRHPTKANITLSDIFIFPDMCVGGGNETADRMRYLSSKQLLSPEFVSNGVLIEGEEKSGRTSLLIELYRQYYERGFVPILINGKDLRRKTDDEIDAAVRRAVRSQYDLTNQDSFLQLPSSKKILLLDNFDESSMKASGARIDLLCAFKQRFGHMIITTNELFEMRELINGDASRQLSALKHYQLQPFGYSLRSRLAEKWYSIGQDGSLDEAELIARCDHAERLMNAIMAKSIIPSHPLYLITLLQSLDAGRTGDFKESALGHYYEYLLTEALNYSGVKPDKLTEIFQYSAHLAWEFHFRGKSELTFSELRDFNSRFSKEWVTVDLNPRLDLLLKSRVLAQSGEDYKFRYPYIYYFLKGMYLSQNLQDLDIRAYIGKCTTHLYVRDNANTVLFLAHHTNDDFVLRSISDALHGLFNSHAPVRFDGDTSGVEKLIIDAPLLSYDGESPMEHRRRRHEIHDELDDGEDGLSDFEENNTELSLIAQMTMLFKTTEILGQILKNQYAKISRHRKVELLEELFNGPLRALQDFYRYLGDNPDSLVREIENALERKKLLDKPEERKIAARKVVASIVQMITFGFVIRASQSANSESLSEDVKTLVQKNPSNAFKLIELGIILDSPRPIPRAILKKLHKDLEKDIVASRLLRVLIIHRLYMFKTKEQDIQWLSTTLGIEIQAQHMIAYQETSTKLLN